ncbi:glycosyltransferase family 9 protein [Planctomycetales bacterium ZRK34]|nr:glycosyltransferase family 9 protein [Planctomycetales bacterium ZRK34]
MSVSTTKPRRILIIRPSALGDVARTVPALVSLKRTFPEAQIDWLVQDCFAEAIAHHPDLGEVIPFARKRFRRVLTNFKVMGEMRRFLGDLRRRGYDRVYDLQGLGRSGFFTWATRAPFRAGPRDAREMAWLGYTHRVQIDHSIQHTVDRMLAVMQADDVPIVRDMRIYVGETDRAWARDYFEQQQIDPARCAVVAPTARWLSKCWPVARYGELIDRLSEAGFEAAAIVGAPNDREQVSPLLENRQHPVRRLDLVGATSVGQLMAVIEASGLVLANDSAALHIAIGLGKRAVCVFGPTNPAKVGPYRYDTGLVCAESTTPADRVNYRSAGNDQSLIATVSTEQVWAATRRVLEAPPPTTRHDD